jgi:hypothetical protein
MALLAHLPTQNVSEKIDPWVDDNQQASILNTPQVDHRAKVGVWCTALTPRPSRA